jgi:hypothetical protein
MEGIHYMELKGSRGVATPPSLAANPLHGVESIKPFKDVVSEYRVAGVGSRNPLHGVERESNLGLR